MPRSRGGGVEEGLLSDGDFVALAARRGLGPTIAVTIGNDVQSELLARWSRGARPRAESVIRDHWPAWMNEHPDLFVSSVREFLKEHPAESWDTRIEMHAYLVRLTAVRKMGGRGSERDQDAATLQTTDTNSHRGSMTMSSREDALTSQDHDNMDAFLGAVLEDFKAGLISKAQVVGGLAHVIAAIDSGNYGEARSWFAQGRKFIRETR